MSLEKIEQLVDRINQAIKAIQALKEERKKLINEINTLKSQNEKLSSENLILKQEKTQLVSDKNENIRLHKLLEEKIEEIIESLPPDDININQQKPTNNEKSKQLRKENIQKKVPVEKVNQKGENNLFEFDNNEDEEIVLDNFENNGQNNLNIKKSNDEYKDFDNEVKIDFEEAFVNDSDNKDVNFYIDNKRNVNDDLPKGVL